MKKFKLHFWTQFKYILYLILSVECHKIHISHYVIFCEEEPTDIYKTSSKVTLCIEWVSSEALLNLVFLISTIELNLTDAHHV